MNDAPGPLAGLRVLELADEKGQFCGKLLADLGADVVKIEPPGGEANRHVGPFLDDVAHPDRSLSFWYYNTSKRSITLALQSADGRALFRRLAATSDVILESFRPGFLASLGLDYDGSGRAGHGGTMRPRTCCTWPPVAKWHPAATTRLM
jgi:crotonobetainyl-CoA:carnitine CoA-transferase CaiB-like acyl-CoA transferase